MAEDSDWAYRRALIGLQQADDEACRKAWDRLERDFGWPTAAAAWRRAAAELDVVAEAAAQKRSIGGGPTECDCDDPVIDVDVDSVCRRCGRTVNFVGGPTDEGSG